MSPANFYYNSTRCSLRFELHFQRLKAHYIISNLHVNLADLSWLHDFQVIHYPC